MPRAKHSSLPAQSPPADSSQAASDALLHHMHALLSAWGTAYEAVQHSLGDRETALTDAQLRVQQLERQVAQV